MSAIKIFQSKVVLQDSKTFVASQLSSPVEFLPFWVNAPISPITNYDIQGSAIIREDDNNGSYGLSTSDLNGIDSILVQGQVYGGDINLAGSTSLTTINMSYVYNVDVSNCTNLQTASFTEQLGVGFNLNANGCSSLTSLNTQYAYSINLNGSNNLQSVSVTYSVTTPIDLNLANRSNLTFLDISNSFVNILDISNCTSLTNITKTSQFYLTALTSFIADNSALTAIDFPFQYLGTNVDFSLAGCTNLTSVNCYYNYMPEGILDGILVDLDTNGASNGYVNLKGPSYDQNRIPSSTGLTAAQNLINKGWSVLLDAPIVSGTAFWTGASSLPSGYTYTGGTITEDGNDLKIDDITLLQTFSSSATNAGGTVNLNGATSLTDLQIQQALLTGTNIDLTGCTLLSTLNLASNDLTSIVGLTTLTSLTSLNVSISAFLTLGSELTSLSNLNTLNVSFGLNTGSTLDLSGMNSLTTINATSSYIGSVILDNAGSGLGADFSNCTSMTSFSAANANIGTLNLSNSNNITTIGAGTGAWYFASDINLSNCNLSAANLNIILGNLASVMTPTNANGTLNIAGNTQDGTTAGYITTIQGNGWTVIQ